MSKSLMFPSPFIPVDMEQGPLEVAVSSLCVPCQLGHLPPRPHRHSLLGPRCPAPHYALPCWVLRNGPTSLRWGEPVCPAPLFSPRVISSPLLHRGERRWVTRPGEVQEPGLEMEAPAKSRGGDPVRDSSRGGHVAAPGPSLGTRRVPTALSHPCSRRWQVC